jgi:protein required for attachment to host cells
MTKVTTWVLVADGVHGAIYANRGPGQGLEELAVHKFIGDKHPTREINADRPGRTFNSMGEQRHAKEPHTDAHRHAQQVLAHEIAKYLDHAVGRGEYDRLVVAAPPRTLGDLRAEFSARVQAKLAGELNKDLTHFPAINLPEHFEAIVRL